MATETKPPETNATDPFAHERGIGAGIDNVEDPQGEYRNEGYGQTKGWHQGGDYGAGSAANLGRSAGEIALEDSAGDDQKAKEKQGGENQPGDTTAESQKTDPNQAPGSNTSSTSTGVVSDPDRK